MTVPQLVALGEGSDYEEFDDVLLDLQRETE
jgi:hypothetical protein